MHFGTAGLERCGIVLFRGAGGAAAAVSAGFAAKQNNHIPCSRHLAPDIFGRHGTDNSADFKPFCHIAFVVDFIYLTGGEPDLVTVRGVAGGCSGDNFSLR